MNQLRSLRQQLRMLRRRQRWLRWGMAWTACLVTLLSSFMVIFALDVWLNLSVIQRLTLLLVGAVAFVWSARRFMAPWLGVHETETDAALFVERQHEIDSDLVAALQFDEERAAPWGSHALQTAVVVRVAELGRQLNVYQGLDHGPLRRRAKRLAAAFAVVAVIAMLFPRHVTIFFARLALADRHYPSATVIEYIRINGAVVWDESVRSNRPRDSRAAKGRPVRFIVSCSGELPAGGSIACRSIPHDSNLSLELRQLTSEELATLRHEIVWPVLGGDRSTSGTAGRPKVVYLAELPRMVEAFDYTLQLGDAWTDAARIQIIEPPVIDVTTTVTPPAYAGRPNLAHDSSRLLAVLEGSRIALDVRCLQPKRLESATITIDAGGVLSSYPFVKQSADGTQWSLPPDTVLANVTQELRYAIQVVDQDGLQLELPLQGFVQLKIDRPPAAVALTVHRVVLPGAKPVIAFRLSDDFGIATAVLQGLIQRNPKTGDSSAGNRVELPDEKLELRIPLDRSPLVGQNLPYRGNYLLDLAPYKLVQGDQLKLQIAVTDYRGDSEGKQVWSEPLLLQVTNEAGVLAAIAEADEQSEKRLGEVLEQQLSVGDGR